jgi:hypothetical protein
MSAYMRIFILLTKQQNALYIWHAIALSPAQAPCRGSGRCGRGSAPRTACPARSSAPGRWPGRARKASPLRRHTEAFEGEAISV